MRTEEKYSSILEFLNRIENDFPVNEWKLYDFYIWPVIRIALGMKLSYENLYSEKNQITSANSSLVKDSLNSIYLSEINSIHDSKKNQNAKGKYDILFLNVSSTRYYKIGDKWFNPFSDSFVNYLEKENVSSLVLEYPDEQKIPRYRGSKYIGTGINLMNLNVLFQKRFEKADITKLKDFNNFLGTIKLSEDFFLKKILRVLNYSYYYEKILKKTNPSVVIVEGFYSYIAMGLVLAAHRQNVKCIDVQHGVQSENDFLYSKWTKLPVDGYELLPDIFWCWCEVEKNSIDKWAMNSKKNSAITGGNPVLELDENNENIKKFTSEIESIKNSSLDSINILYTHQASFEISETLFNVIKKSPANWKWWVRFHPQYKDAQGMVAAKIAKYNFPNVISENVIEYPLPLLLKNMDLHVTEFSSSVLEAEMLGVPSIVLDKSGVELFSNQIQNCIARYAENESSFFKDAEFLLNKKNTELKNNNEENFKTGIEMLLSLVEEKKKS
ncbi:MAG: hypothetical protein JST55_04085 [Bacteroidetes bacterium]|nr:hypothetical protein [Bacteroidota bacterium]